MIRGGQFQIGFLPRLAALYAAFFVVAGIHQPFFPVWLKAKGLDAAAIGLVLALPQMVRILAIPLVTRAADRRDQLRPALIITCCLAAAGYAATGLAEGPTAILAIYALAALAFTPVLPLAEAYAFKGLAAHGRAYGPVRLWGSASFIVGNVLAGFAADRIDARNFIWLIVAASALNALVSLTLRPLPATALAAHELKDERGPLLRDPAFLAVVAAASLIQASHAVFYGFAALEWRGLGIDNMVIALLWAIGVLAEIVLFAFSARLPAFIQPIVLIMIGAAGATLRWGAMALVPPTAALPLLQVLHALSFGATHLGAVTYIARYAPPGHSARAQGYLSIAMGITLAGAMGLSGVLYGTSVALAYAAMALAAIVGGACALGAQRARREMSL
jgi:PPP family 3-phenylpropionic acid transporter